MKSMHIGEKEELDKFDLMTEVSTLYPKLTIAYDEVFSLVESPCNPDYERELRAASSRVKKISRRINRIEELLGLP